MQPRHVLRVESTGVTHYTFSFIEAYSQAEWFALHLGYAEIWVDKLDLQGKPEPGQAIVRVDNKGEMPC